ncbi:MAG: type II secretion system protein [Gemmatimonadota bacterium]|nr:type II secretion system protein [Gemmatimonadota bacterium]
MTVRGFTLIELMIAIVILALAILGMATVLLGTSQWQERSESALELTTAAEAKLEDFRDYSAARTADTVQLLPGGSLTSSVDDHADSLRSAEGRWILRRWEVTSGPGSARTVALRVAPRNENDHTGAARDFHTIILMAP